MTAKLFTLPKQFPLDNSGALIPGAKMYFYVNGTSTKQDTYTTSALSVANTNPIIADGNGLFGPIYLDGAKRYKVKITDADDVELYTEDDFQDSLDAATVGKALYPQTTGESAAGVTPTNYEYPPGNVLRYGADRDGVEDSATAAQAAVDVAVANGTNEVYFPFGTYLLGTSVGPASEMFGLVIKGDGIQDTVITGTHNEGPVLFLNRSNSRVCDLTITADTTRQNGSDTATGASWENNVGLLLEPADTLDKFCSQCDLTRVRILNQPSHGLAWIGPAQNNVMKQVLVQDNAGHGAMFDGGIVNSRSNYRQFGQMTAIDFWAVNNGGNGAAVGNTADIATTTPYRFLFLNGEFTGNGTDATYRYSDDEVWVHGENCHFVNGAVGGSNTRGGIAFQGKEFVVENMRFVESQPALTLYDSPVAGQVTKNIQVRSIRNVSTSPALDPAIVIDDLDSVRNVRVETASGDNVTSWFADGAQNCVVNDSEPITIVERATDGTPVNNSTTLVNDTDLKIGLIADENVTFEAMIRYVSDSTADIKFAFTAPSGATVRWNPLHSIYIAASDTITVKSGEISEGTGFAFGGSTGTRTLIVYGFVNMASTGGNLQLQMAQNTATVVDTKILAGSMLRVYRSNYGN